MMFELWEIIVIMVSSFMIGYLVRQFKEWYCFRELEKQLQKKHQPDYENDN